MQERTLHLYGLISPETIAPIYTEMVRINQEDRHSTGSIPPIQLHINSAGGDVYDALPLLSLMGGLYAPIHTYCYGYVMSAALTLFTGGDRRFGGKYSQYMLHDTVVSLPEALLTTQEHRIEEFKRMRNIRTNYICGRTNLTHKHFEDNKFTDYFMDVHTAIELGVVHEVV